MLETPQHTILAIDDEPSVLDYYRHLLRVTGYAVLTANSAEHARQLMGTILPDLILADIMMPGFSGLDFLRELKADARRAQIPVIIITGRTSDETLIEAFEAGAVDFLRKPFNRVEFTARIGSHLRLYDALLEIQRLSQFALEANPLTHLPGNTSLAKRIAEELASSSQSCVIYGDLDNFKAYNDVYGYAAGDRVIRYTADLLSQTAAEYMDDAAFVAHIGGDDFALIVPSDKGEAIGKAILERFDLGVPDFYAPEARAAGGLIATDRLGQEQRYPIMTISLAALHLGQHRFEHHLEVAQHLADIKKRAKASEKSILFFERRGAERGAKEAGADFEANSPEPVGSTPALEEV